MKRHCMSRNCRRMDQKQEGEEIYIGGCWLEEQIWEAESSIGRQVRSVEGVL